MNDPKDSSLADQYTDMLQRLSQNDAKFAQFEFVAQASKDIRCDNARQTLGAFDPPQLTSIPVADIFVFGSNERGIHGSGAARFAHEKRGAVLQIGFGHQGNSFAIPTCSKPTGAPGHEISFEQLKFYIDCFILYATQHPEWRFQVTRIGCGLAGWKDEVVAPLFANAPDNCAFDTLWTTYLPNARFWGTF